MRICAHHDLPLDESETMLDGDTIPAVYGVECSFSLTQRASLHFVRCNEQWVAHICFVPQQSLSSCQRRSVLAEQTHIMRDTNMWSTVPHEIATVVTHGLHLSKQRKGVDISKVRTCAHQCAPVRLYAYDDLQHVSSVLSIVVLPLQCARRSSDVDGESIN